MVFYKKEGLWGDSDKDRQRLFAEAELIISICKKRNTYIGNEASKSNSGDGEREEYFEE